ncbi:MAG: NosR/NirI family nitrous oxide reductase transcriptional regulator [Kiritimatiellia bacterium]|jgi:NosR/NirI family nitrous oxide reductase transcriptional regulator
MFVFLLFLLSALAGDGSFVFKAEGLDEPLDCVEAICSDYLPGASRFEVVEGKPYQVGYDDAGEVVGWVVRSTDVTDRVGYSGKPLVTLIGVTPQGTFAHSKVIYHSEPILLLGIPQAELDNFVNSYDGRRLDEPIEVGAKGEHGVDVISGATVTVLAENATMLEVARHVAVDAGVLDAGALVPGHFVEDKAWTWQALTSRGALGHLVVRAEDMGLPPRDQPFVDIWFGIADAPQVGIPLLGEPLWRYYRDHLEEGEHMFVVFNSGFDSFRGSGFVRGGIFDRFRVDQNLSTLLFTDLDYIKLDRPKLDGVPDFRESGLFFSRDGRLDPGLTYRFTFLGSKYDGEGGFSRDFATFSRSHRLPNSVYVLDGPDPERPLWMKAWDVSWHKAVMLSIYLVLLTAVFAGRRWSTRYKQRLHYIHNTFLTISFVGLGLGLVFQPSVTQLLTLVGSVPKGGNWGLFLSDPMLFIGWMFIATTTIIWGRGVFCGWACPYGAMTEVLFKVARLVKLPSYELPDAIHHKLKYFRYVIFVALLAVFLYSPEMGERMAEVEPFKSTFFVAFWTRHFGFILWWVVLLVTSVFVWRPFCRYVCPLGAALAVVGSVRISGPYRREFCSKCKICTRECEPRAFRKDGTIDPRECLSCMQCEANYKSEYVCPPLVKERRARERGAKQDKGAA